MANNPSERIEGQLPKHYKEYYQRFIAFMQAYYDWLHRESGLTSGEVELLRSDTSWVKTDIDGFMNSGSIQNIGSSDVDAAIIEKGNILAPGKEVDMQIPYRMLDNMFDSFISADESYFTTADGEVLESNDYSNDEVDNWLQTFGYSFDNDVSDLNPLDKLLLVRLLKYIYKIKGTKKSIELFFSMYFGETVEVYYPKFDVAVIDDNFILDDKKFIRDDYYYQEYSYVIRVQQDPSVYQQIFDKVYMKHIHPSGFNVFLEQQQTS